MMQQTLFGDMKEEIITSTEQEYVPVSYNDPHDHLPVLWRVLVNGDIQGGVEGNAMLCPWHSKYSYAYAYLDRIFYNKKRRNRNLLSFSKRIFHVYFHEFLHLYFNDRFEASDTYNYKKPNNYKPENYDFTYSRKWGSNERVIEALTNKIKETMFEDCDFVDLWIECFSDCKVHLNEGKQDD